MVNGAIKSLLAGWAILSTLDASAAPVPFDCPASLPAMTQTLTQVPADFEVAVDRPYHKHTLEGFRVQMGPLETADATRYDQHTNRRDSRGGQVETLTWKLAAYETPYAVCAYRATTLVLVRPLSGYSECQVVSKAAPSGLLRIESASCR